MSGEQRAEVSVQEQLFARRAERAHEGRRLESTGGVGCCHRIRRRNAGDTDVFLICDLPDDASAVALSMLVNSSGVVRGTMTPLMTPEDLDDAAKKSPLYRPPGADG